MDYRRKHTKLDVENEEMKRILMGSMEKFSEQTSIWKTWVDRVTQVEDYERVIAGLGLGKRATEEIGTLVEASSDITIDAIRTKTLTYWLFFNILSQYITHRITSENRRIHAQDQMRKYF